MTNALLVRSIDATQHSEGPLCSMFRSNVWEKIYLCKKLALKHANRNFKFSRLFANTVHSLLVSLPKTLIVSTGAHMWVCVGAA